MCVNHSTRLGGTIWISSIFFNMKVCCLFSFALPHRGDSNDNTQHTIFNIKKKIPNLQLRDCFQGTQERARNRRGKRAISVRDTDGDHEYARVETETLAYVFDSAGM